LLLKEAYPSESTFMFTEERVTLDARFELFNRLSVETNQFPIPLVSSRTVPELRDTKNIDNLIH